MQRGNLSILSIVAQEDNLGDIVIRKALLDSLSCTSTELYIYCGKTSDSYRTAYEIDAKHRLFNSSIRLQLEVFKRALTLSRLHLFIAPGPSSFSSKPKDLLKCTANLLNALLVRATGGTVHIIGRAYRGEGLTKLLYSAMLLLANKASVRDSISKVNVKDRAILIPDFGFVRNANHCSVRPYAAISLRNADKFDDESILNLLNCIRFVNLKPVFVTQVKRDNDAMQALAQKFGSEIIEWRDQPHSVQLRRVEQIYSASSIVISNRLHGLILGAVAGCQPIPLADKYNSKLVPTLSTVFPDIESLSEDDLRTPDESILRALSSRWNRSSRTSELSLARKQVHQHLLEVRSSIELN